ncbi:MAG: carbonic anhydrase [Brumimicrobium sp.]|nr:carbonic anhydrase [Brumimicrobium sp.]MCO5268185.1 carbonic anhydrase [Brumimicrobium sp.]
MEIADVLRNNEKWVNEKLTKDSEFFKQMAEGQSPSFLFIGCSDSRVTAEAMMGVGPGEVFSHRNISNMAPNNDLNVLSVIYYAVEYLKVPHIIVCGHYGCGGIKAAMLPKDNGLLNPWLRNIRDVYRLHKTELNAIKDEAKRYDRLVELNVYEQVINVIKTKSVQLAISRKEVQVHGWVFDMKTGRIIDQKIDVDQIMNEIMSVYNVID